MRSGNMKLKKWNAALGLASAALLTAHAGYNIFAYFTLYYNPGLSQLFSVLPAAVICAHAVLGMLSVFLQGDGTRMDLYPGYNRSTILQRVSAALMVPMLLLHIKTFDLLSGAAKGGQWFLFGLILFSEVVFYGLVLTHVAVSFSRALVTLGLLASREKQRKLDRFMYILCAVIFAAAVWSVLSGQIKMFVP